MKKLLLLTTILLGLAGCGADSATSKTDSTKQIESSTSQSSSIKSTKQSIAETSENVSEPTESSVSENQTSDTEFKELLSGIEYNKEYLTQDQIIELKETYKSILTNEQYQELVKMLEGIQDGDA
ncbi:MAG: hypothetical protein ACLRPU_03780 [Enterococcus hulanensis]